MEQEKLALLKPLLQTILGSQICTDIKL